MRKLTIFILSFACFVASVEAVPTYRIRDLGDLPGGQNRSFAIDINNAGWIVGEVGAPGGPRAALWKRLRNGTYKLVNLGTLNGHNSSIANSINADNVIVGRSSIIGDHVSRDGVRWSPRRNGTYGGRSVGDLADVGCTDEFAFQGTEAFAINNNGWTVGISLDCSFVWKPSIGISPLFLFPGAEAYERLVDINNNNIAVGTITEPPGCCGPRPVVWNTAQLTKVFLPVDSGRGYAEGINGKGWIVGQDGDFTFGCCDMQAVLWKPEVDGNGYTTTILGPYSHLTTAFTSEAKGLDINRHDQVVGSVQVTDGTTGALVKAFAFYWDEATGFRSLQDLVARNDPLRGKFKLLRAYAISDRGLIVGYGLTAGKKFHAFLLKP